MKAKALIVGGGIGGLAAGIALQRANIDVQIVERAAEMREVGAGISLWANAIAALETLGLADRVRQIGMPAIAGLRDRDGTVLTDPSALAPLLRDFPELCLVVHRAQLLALLLDALGPPRVSLGWTFVHLEDDEEGVTIESADGQRLRGDLLIGADGLHSVVRARLHGERPPSYSGYTAWRATVPFTGTLRPGETWGCGARFGHMPLRGGRVYWYAAQNAPEGELAHSGEKAALQEITDGWHDPIPQLIAATPASAILRNDIYDRPVLTEWGRGRFTLLGDAAHPMTPNLGQGACQALEDAVALGDSLGAANDPIAGLREYERRRTRRANALVIRSRLIGWVAHTEHGIALRNALVKHLGSRLQAREFRAILGGGPC